MVVYHSVGCRFNSNFLLLHVDVPLGKALNPTLLTKFSMNVSAFENGNVSPV